MQPDMRLVTTARGRARGSCRIGLPLIGMSLSSEGNTIRFGRFVVLAGSRRLLDGDKPVPIEGKPFELLLALLEKPGEMVRRDALYARLWPDVSADYRNGLDTAVKKLRQALGDSLHHSQYIETVARGGYALRVPVRVDEPLSPGAASMHASNGLLRDPEGRRWFLEGYHCWNKRTAAAEEKALGCFVQASQCDPANAACHAAIAQTWIMLANHGARRPVEAMAEARSAAGLALHLDPHCHTALCVLAHLRGAFDFDLTGSVSQLRDVVRMAPDSSWAYVPLSFVAAALGCGDEALAMIRRALDNDPISPTIRALQGYTMYLTGQFAEAVALGRNAVARDPEFGLGHWYLAQELIAAGRPDLAVPELTAAAWLRKNSINVRAILGLALARCGRVDHAARIDASLEASARRRYVDAYHRAILKEALGMRGASIALLKEAADSHSHWFALARVDPKLDSLRADLRVTALLRRLG